MTIHINYGKAIAVLPESVYDKIDRATKRDLKVLFALASVPNTVTQQTDIIDALTEKVGCRREETEASVSFWRGAGVIETDETETVENTAKAKEESNIATFAADGEKKPELPDELPIYTTAELNRLLEKKRESALLIDECQRIVGKIFNPHEISILIGLQDYLELDSDYIMTLTDYCVRHGKKSLQYIKKVAFSYYNSGVTDAELLHAYLKRLDAAETVEGEIRKMFGINERVLTAKEKKLITEWVNDFGYSTDVIRKAYEMTVDAISKPSFPYAHAIMLRWHQNGFNDLAAIEASKEEEMPKDGSFDTVDFFESALKRSFSKNNQGG